jgi:hypothetical protein
MIKGGAVSRMISIFTLTLGRAYYLNRQLRSVAKAAATYDGRITHHLCFQGVQPDPSTLVTMDECSGENLAFKIHPWDKNLGIAGGVNRIVPQLEGSLLMKMDDDCLLLSDDFFTHVEAVHQLHPEAVFSPFPVGILMEVGGPDAIGPEVSYSPDTETYYTLRHVPHIGGLCRIAPAEKVRKFKLKTNLSNSGTEDTQHSALCRANGIEMFYLENALVVEHQESAMGQKSRQESYFQDKSLPRTTYSKPNLYQRWMRRLEGRFVRTLRKLY